MPSSHKRTQTHSQKKRVSSQLTLGELSQALDLLAPVESAEKWDQVGLLVGDPKSWVTRAVVSIDLNTSAIELAKKTGANVIITHHPCFFPKSAGITKIIAPSLVYSAIREGIGIVASHTNFDQCALEVVQQVSKSLGVKPLGRLLENEFHALLSLVVYVPIKNLDEVRNALCSAGAGIIGEYDSCSFYSEGKGTFRGNSESKPAVGKAGRLETGDEIRLEMNVPNSLRKSVVAALLESHPYEDVAYHFTVIHSNAHSQGVIRGLGYGFWGDFPSPKRFSEIAKNVKSVFGINGFWITDPEPKRVSRIGFVAGKGASFIDQAISIGCDLLITGECGYHNAMRGLNQGMGVMEIGHQESEKFFIATMKDWLNRLHIEAAECITPIQKIWAGGN